MKFGLVRKFYSRSVGIRNLIDKLCIESKFVCQVGVALQTFPILLLFAIESSMQKTGNPFEFAIDLFGGNELMDLVQGRDPSFPKCSSGILAKSFYEMVKAIIGHIGEMCRGVTCVCLRASLSFQQRDPGARFLEQMRRGNTGKPSTDDHDIDFQIAA